MTPPQRQAYGALVPGQKSSTGAGGWARPASDLEYHIVEQWTDSTFPGGWRGQTCTNGFDYQLQTSASFGRRGPVSRDCLFTDTCQTRLLGDGRRVQ